MLVAGPVILSLSLKLANCKFPPLLEIFIFLSFCNVIDATEAEADPQERVSPAPFSNVRIWTCPFIFYIWIS